MHGNRGETTATVGHENLTARDPPFPREKYVRPTAALTLQVGLVAARVRDVDGDVGEVVRGRNRRREDSGRKDQHSSS